MIGSYNNYHLSPNSIPSGNQRWYGLVYKYLVNLGQSPGNSCVALGTLLGRVSFRENIHIRTSISKKLPCVRYGAIAS